MRPHTLVAHPDSAGDVLLAGPATRAAAVDRVSLVGAGATL